MNRGFSAPPQKTSSRQEETIAAISTPYGESGIGIVRMSGHLAEPIAKKIFRPKNDQPHFISHHFHYGEIIDPDKRSPIDEVLIVLMKSPKTYTREDIVEIHCHGGYLVLQKVLELVLKQGARMAEPGEFTRKAFLNGRIDLTQAEAVIDLIRAKTETSLEIANQQRRGMFFTRIAFQKDKLINVLAMVEAHIDFPEEEIDPFSLVGARRDLEQMTEEMEAWITSYEEGKLFREGISCAIVGKTNVGKSSLLNVLLEEDRAIVTPIPGTTRDVIEEVLNIRGIPVRLSDTAGLRKTTDSIEQEGVKKAKERLADSDFVILVLDGSHELDEEDLEIFKETEGKKKVVALNKKDLSSKVSIKEVQRLSKEDPIISISALNDEGIDDLREAVYSSLIHRELRSSPEHLIVANLRHKNALVKASGNLSNALRGLEEGISLEFIAFEIRSALDAIGELVGETTNEEVLNRIFEQFCIGK